MRDSDADDLHDAGDVHHPDEMDTTDYSKPYPFQRSDLRYVDGQTRVRFG